MYTFHTHLPPHGLFSLEERMGSEKELNMKTEPVVIDGSAGEGGGQILRSSLALSLATGRPFRIEKIRAGRKKPGLLRQHLTAVTAAAEVGGADVRGAVLGSTELSFSPADVRPGEYHFAVGTAGSATLVLQTVLPALLTAPHPSSLVLEGGTHNPFAPPFDFLAKAFVPLVERMGPRVDVILEQPGFYPAGGGRFRARVEPAPRLDRIDLLERGEIRRKLARAMVSHLPRNVADREIKTVRDLLSWDRQALAVEEVTSSGPGNVLMLELECEHVTEVFTAFGERATPAEAVAQSAVKEVLEYLSSDAPVGRHLADQLLIPMALAGGGSLRTVAPTRHTTTNIEVLKQFLSLEVRVEKEDRGAWRILIERHGPIPSPL
jgi:RNA 3'-terminal phosphate cyclase (ATP)